MAGETATQFLPILYLFGFGILAGVPSIVLSRLLMTRRRHNPVKFLPM
ncbi:MAG: NADH-quinone oxidoreductase subunit A, partial [Candidatus Nitrosocosmicus sp.]|nr:NADH-quinone oxidoreductase subunit A [Candidatus Nitrosocosmicus sp.]